jgi:hypothetical protein
LTEPKGLMQVPAVRGLARAKRGRRLRGDGGDGARGDLTRPGLMERMHGVSLYLKS